MIDCTTGCVTYNHHCKTFVIPIERSTKYQYWHSFIFVYDM